MLGGLIMNGEIKGSKHRAPRSSAYKAARRRRGRHDIIMDILKIAGSGTVKTNIMSKAKLSYTQLELYLKALEKADLVREESGIWLTTEKGLQVIEACKICNRLMKEVM